MAGSRSLQYSPLALALLACVLAAPTQALELHNARLHRAPDHTRVVFDLSGPTDHLRHTLSAPERLVLDIADIKLTTNLGRLDLKNTPIRRIRSAPRNGDNLRIVFDLHGPVSHHSFLLGADGERGNRLVVDLGDIDPGTNPAAPSVKKSVAMQDKRKVVIAIDAGHGGQDPGASGPGGLREKDVVLAIAKDLHRRFKGEDGFSAVLVRADDTFIALRQRRDIAKAARADLLVSIHADSFHDHRARGASAYVYSQRGASSTFAKFLAERENAADLVGGVSLHDKEPDLGKVLYDLSQTGTLDASFGLGEQLLRELGAFNRLHRRRVEQAAFVVLKSPDIPSVLVETGFISNPDEARLLRSRPHQRKLAAALHRGIKDWFFEHPPDNTLLAWWKSRGGREYIIVRGDTLSEIAQKFDVSLAALRSRNALSGSTIHVGQRLIIPTS